MVAVTETGGIALTVPAGESAALDLDDARQLWRDLREAVIAASIYHRPDLRADLELVEPRAARAGRFVVACRDAAHRKRDLVVIPLAIGRVLIAAPAGGVAVFAPLQVGRLRAALNIALARVVSGPTGVATARIPTERTTVHRQRAVAV